MWPVHLNLTTAYVRSYETRELPTVRVIKRIEVSDTFPELSKGKIAIYLGAHHNMSEKESKLIDDFCERNNAVVFCDHTSSYKGNYRLLFALAAGQKFFDKSLMPDTVIHFGEISGDYQSLKLTGAEVWRVSPDGEVRDTFRKLTKVFEMPESLFLQHYIHKSTGVTDSSYFNTCSEYVNSLRANIPPNLPFSNIWVASQMSKGLPENCTIHFGILNSLRSWNFFEIPRSVLTSSNVGGFGIDGNISSLVGASLADPNKLYFGVIGDLAFFYDMNVLGNRHRPNNLRIMVVNNGKGTEFRQYSHIASILGDEADRYVAAAGHFGNKSPVLIKNYGEALGFEYLTASNKEQLDERLPRFLNSGFTQKPMLFEVFTNSEDESIALEKMLSIEQDDSSDVKKIAKQMLGKKGISTLKKVLKK